MKAIIKQSRRTEAPVALFPLPPLRLLLGGATQFHEGFREKPVASLSQRTRNMVLLSNVPLGIVTCTWPEVAPTGTVALIKAFEGR